MNKEFVMVFHKFITYVETLSPLLLIYSIAVDTTSFNNFDHF